MVHQLDPIKIVCTLYTLYSLNICEKFINWAIVVPISLLYEFLLMKINKTKIRSDSTKKKYNTRLWAATNWFWHIVSVFFFIFNESLSYGSLNYVNEWSVWWSWNCTFGCYYRIYYNLYYMLHRHISDIRQVLFEYQKCRTFHLLPYLYRYIVYFIIDSSQCNGTNTKDLI